LRATLGLLLSMLAAQCVLGQLGWFYRYDAYLVMPLVLCSAAALLQHAATRNGSRRRFAGCLRIASTLFLLGSAPRGLYALRNTAGAAGNIFMQQVQTARFLAEYFPEGRVLVNDIGAVAYYRRAPMIDLMGLANRDVAEARGWRIDRPLPLAALTRLSDGTEVAVIYEPWFEGALPATWSRVATWTIPNNRVCAFPTITVYATRAAAVARVHLAVRSFEPHLPRDVELQ
jgi:hypothetical protein